MPSFLDYVSQWRDLCQTIQNYVLNKSIVIPTEFINILKQYKELVDHARNALDKDDTIINKDLTWADHGLDCNDILLMPFIEYGTSNGVDMATCIYIFQSNKVITSYEQKIYDFLQEKSIDDPSIINTLMNDLCDNLVNPDIKKSNILEAFYELIDEKNEIDQIGID